MKEGKTRELVVLSSSPILPASRVQRTSLIARSLDGLGLDEAASWARAALDGVRRAAGVSPRAGRSGRHERDVEFDHGSVTERMQDADPTQPDADQTQARAARDGSLRAA